MILKTEEWNLEDRRVKDLYVAATEDGDRVNRYISHKEVMDILFDGDPSALSHQFIEVKDRGLVRTHTKALTKCLDILVSSHHPDMAARKHLEEIITFLSENKPTKGRNTEPIGVGSKRTVTVNKNQGYILVPNVGQVFKLDTDEDGHFIKQQVIVVYESEDEIVIKKQSWLNNPNMYDGEVS